MDQQRKNPYRRPPSHEATTTTTERRPGLRQLPADLEELASGKAERLRRPRPEPSPLRDEREGAVIPGVRNSDARTVYDAHVSRLRAHLAAGRESELRAGLEAVRSLALWRARNVTDYRAFAESVVGIAPELAQTLVDEAERADVAHKTWPDHTVALAVRVEAAALARDPGACVALTGELANPRLTLELTASDVGRSVETLTDVGETAAGLRRFLRGHESPAFSDRGPRARSDEARQGYGQAQGRGNFARRDNRSDDRRPERQDDRGFARRDDRRFESKDDRRSGPRKPPSPRPPFRGNTNNRDDRRPPSKGPRR